MELDLLLRLLASLAENRVEYVLIGAAALNVLGLVRATEDADIFIRPDADNVAALRRALDALFHDPEIEKITASDLLGEYPAVMYVPPSGDFRLDILSRLGDAVRYADLEWETRELDGVPVRVATPRSLYRMKRDTIRPMDRIDAEMLRREFGLEEE